MNILLINPPRFNIVKWTANDWELDLADISSFPPLRLMYISSYLRAHSKHEIRIIDAVAERLSYESLQEHISYYKPEIVGITAFTYTFYDVLKTARLVKQLLPSCHVSVGDPHVFRLQTTFSTTKES